MPFGELTTSYVAPHYTYHWSSLKTGPARLGLTGTHGNCPIVITAGPIDVSLLVKPKNQSGPAGHISFVIGT